MKSRVCLHIILGAAALCALLFPALSAAQQCIPSCDAKDGRTLAITDGAGLSTLTDVTLDISVRVNSNEDFFLLSFFDGEISGLWDLPVDPGADPEQVFDLYADPAGDGTCGGDGCDASDLILTLSGDVMPDNLWFDQNIANDGRALNDDGTLYIYLLRAELRGDLDPPPVRSSFKVRTGTPEQASIEVFQQPFAFSAAMPSFTELAIIYPGCAGATLPECLASLDETTYDGTFSFYIEQIQPQCEFIVWDGDLDHGSFDGVDTDDNDPNVPDDLSGLPPWACQDPLIPCDATFDGTAWVGPNPPLAAINFEGVALGLCSGGTNDGEPCFEDDPGPQPFVPDCPGGTCSITGDPPDNFDAGAFGGLGAIFVRGGSLTYEVWSPACPSTQAGCTPIAVNTNPSGNQEWEYFRLAVPGGGCYLDANGFPPEVDVAELPAGTYEVRVLDLDLENLNAFRFDGRAVSEPCDECKGGVTELTLEYTGTISNPDPIIRVEKDASNVYFEDQVGPNGRFTFTGPGGDTMGSEIDIYVNNVLNTSIHTSCSQPIFPGLVSGDFTVVSGLSKDNGPICVDIGCNDCDGGVTDLTFRYDGATAVELTVYDSTSADPAKIVFGPAIVESGDEVFFTKRDGQDKFSSNISLWTNGLKLAEVHTSCSQPIGPGLEVGDFVLVAGTSRNGGDMCPLPECQPCAGGISELNFRNVTGGPVAVEIYDDNNVNPDKLLFAGTLADGGETGTLFGTKSDGKFDGDVTIWVGGVKVASIHVSCSQPVGVGMVFGGFEVVSGASIDGGDFCPTICRPLELNFEVADDQVKYRILNDSETPLQIQKLVLEWPEAKGDLKKIDFDGTIFEQIVPWQPGGVVITDFIGDESNRALAAGDDRELKLHFTTKTTAGVHFVRVEFNSGCAVEATAGDDPGDQCAPCAGGVTELNFKNVTGAPVEVEIYDDNNINPDKLLFAGTLADGGETGTLFGTKSDGKFDGDVTIWVGGVKVASIHVSCSQPIGVGLVFGGFEVVSGASKDGGDFCPADCQPSQLKFEVQDDEVRFKIANDGETPLQIQKLVLEWPEAKGALEKIQFDGTIFEQVVPWQAGPVEITDFIGAEGDRTVEAGDNHELKLFFSDKTTGGLHSVRVEFNSGCVIEADSDTPPDPTGDFTCSKDIDALTMIWQPEATSPAAGQTVYVKAWKDNPDETLLDASGPIAIGAEYTVSGYAPKDGNDVVWEIFGDAAYTNLLGTSVYHLSCSDSEMNGADDCGKRQGDGKSNDSSRLNDWLFEGMVDSDETLDCTP